MQADWAYLTPEPYDHAWVQRQATLHTLRTVARALQTAVDRGMTQAKLSGGNVRAYLAGILKNPDRPIQPRAAPDPTADPDYDPYDVVGNYTRAREREMEADRARQQRRTAQKGAA